MQYAERLPIGLANIIKTVPAAAVKGFYERRVLICCHTFLAEDILLYRLGRRDMQSKSLVLPARRVELFAATWCSKS